MTISCILLIALIAPLGGAIVAGIGNQHMPPKTAHRITILGIAMAFLATIALFWKITLHHLPVYNTIAYTWGTAQNFQLNIGFLVDNLTIVMMLTVNFISLLVHIYSIDYMHHDKGYARFFAYMSLFTFFMLVLVTANNFLLLLIGWEGVGLVSYLLIGFWFQKESAAKGSLKAFIVNRIGDFGMMLGIVAIFSYFGTLDYATVFLQTPTLLGQTVLLFPHTPVPLLPLICFLLWIGAMGKSAQIPLHIWLPESMEGPTPISALIHAATMVTAGVYMIARLSPLFEYSSFVLSMILVIGASGAFFLGLVALVQDDIKRVIAYSTLSQLGYMMAANGASAFSAAIFHLVTHAAFKALLFLAAGSVILALHHEQDMRKMGGLYRAMPITYITFLIGALSLAAIPPFSGFYSKEPIIDVVHLATIPGATYAYVCLLLGSFITALYIFRAFFLTFHTKPRVLSQPIKESATRVTIPLILLAIPALIIGLLLSPAMLYDKTHTLLKNSLTILPLYNFFQVLIQDYQSIFQITCKAFLALPVWFALAGILTAWIGYIRLPNLPKWIAKRLSWLYYCLKHQYGFNALYRLVFVQGVLTISQFFFRVAEVKLIDKCLVDGSGRAITKLSAWLSFLHSGYIYHYALAIILGLFAFLACFLPV